MFGWKEWGAVNPDKELNKWVIEAVPGMLNRSANLEHGFNLELIESNPGMAAKLFEESVRAKVADLCEHWDVDAIILIHSGNGSYGFNAGSVRLPGIGLYFGRHNVSYTCIAMSIYDRSAKAFTSNVELARSRELSPLAWRSSMASIARRSGNFSMTAFMRSLPKRCQFVFSGSVWQSQISPLPLSRNRSSARFGRFRSRRITRLRRGDELNIPAGMTPEIVRVAVITAFRERDWKIASSTPERIVGVITEGTKDSVETATLGKDKVILIGERTEAMGDGTRKKIERKERWHRNLKQDVVRELYLHSVQADGP